MNCNMRLRGISQATPDVCTLLGTKPAIAFAAWRNLQDQDWCPWNIFLSGWFRSSSSCSHRHPCCSQRWGLFLPLPKPESRTLWLQLFWPVLTISGGAKKGRTRTIPSPDPQHQVICFWPVPHYPQEELQRHPLQHPPASCRYSIEKTWAPPSPWATDRRYSSDDGN